MSTEKMVELTREELEAALSIATENRRILAQCVLRQEDMPMSMEWEAEYERMISLAKEMVK